jgi:hypothetical protein
MSDSEGDSDFPAGVGRVRVVFTPIRLWYNGDDGYVVDLARCNSADTLRHVVERNFALAPDSFRLVYKGELFEGESTFDSVGFTANDVIRVESTL